MGEAMDDYAGLVKDDPEEAAELLDEWLEEVADGEVSRLEDCARLLRALYMDDEASDLAVEWLEELPNDCPPGLMSAVLALDDRDFANQCAAIIGGHASLTEEELRQFMSMNTAPWSGDSDEYNASKSGRASVTECRNATMEMLLELANDPQDAIRYRVAMNPSITAEVQQALLTASASQGGGLLADYALGALALNRAATELTIQSLAQHQSALIRACVSLRDDLPESLREAREDGNAVSSALPVGRLVWWNLRGRDWMTDAVNSADFLGSG
jgi:hypothetical protein